MTTHQVVLGTEGEVLVQPAPRASVETATDVLIAPLRVGICGSDVHVLHGRHPFVRPPVVTGHEVVARVRELGSGVRGLAAGDLVVVNPLVWCGRCDRCRDGLVNQCDQASVRGFKTPGLARSEVVVDQPYCHRVPAGVPAATAVLTEPLAVGWHATGRAQEMRRVLVVGAGPVGLAVVLSLRWRGAGDITVVEPVAAKRAAARRLGATAAVAPEELTSGLRVDSAFDCVAAGDTLAAAAAATVPGGTIVVVGVPSGEVALPLPRLQRWEIDVRGTGLYLGDDIDAVLARLATSASPAADIVTAEHPVEEAAAAFAATADPEQIKVVLTWRD